MTDTPLQGRVAIITGAASGIGQAVAALLTTQGATVIAADLSRPASLPEGADYLPLDVTEHGQWRSVAVDVAGRHGAVDILVNCAGVLGEGTLWSTSLAEWRRIIGVNVHGTFLGCQAVIPHMPRGGSIVNMGSVSASRGDADLLAYTTSKAAIVNLTREIAMDCARRDTGVRCNSVSPGVVGTAMVQAFFDAGPRATHDEWLATQPLAREIAPGEVAELIAFLVGDDSSFMTGADCPVDCGAMA